MIAQTQTGVFLAVSLADTKITVTAAIDPARIRGTPALRTVLFRFDGQRIPTGLGGLYIDGHSATNGLVGEERMGTLDKVSCFSYPRIKLSRRQEA